MHTHTSDGELMVRGTETETLPCTVPLMRADVANIDGGIAVPDVADDDDGWRWMTRAT